MERLPGFLSGDFIHREIFEKFGIGKGQLRSGPSYILELSGPWKAYFQRSLIEKDRIIHLAEVLPDLHHHRHTYVDDDRGAQGYKGRIDKKETDAINGKMKFFSQPRADPKGPLFKEQFQFFHSAIVF